MLGIGMGELVVVLIVVLLAVGPERMPQFVRVVGRGLRQVRKASRQLREASGIDELLRDEELAELRAMRLDGPPVRSTRLTETERLRESPPEGVDIAWHRVRGDVAGTEVTREPR
ncbi:MAG: twin-arginine translocase TatA/TatE family subunit [Myxococcota bacterium]|nr:twin-arginine translocase TatA/TatE family subunit [Myxococcota bacterium]MDW8361000.1 twin-arginine translocase TatA/TatE family subunit [Myxococcales bacterium]